MRKIIINQIYLFFFVCIILSLISCVSVSKENLIDTNVEAGKIDIPNPDGYITLKGDFHIHTVFSDGQVTYKDRVTEAYREGLDVIAVTDHDFFRYAVKNWFTKKTKNRLWEQALEYAEERGVLLIKGIELTYWTPTGHLNAIFLKDTDKFYHTNIFKDLYEARNQNAFVFWNHLYNYKHSSDGTYFWPIHYRMLEEGLLHGIELNGSSCDEAFALCLEHNLTIIGSTDIHIPMKIFTGAEHRRMTLIFARERTLESIHEALLERRTAYYNNNNVYGEEKYIKELFEKALQITVRKTGNTANLVLKNNSDLIFRLSINNTDKRELNSIVIGQQSEMSINVELNDIIDNKVILFVNNFFVGPGKVMEYVVGL